MFALISVYGMWMRGEFSLRTTRLGLYILYTPSGLNWTGGGAHDSAAKVGRRILPPPGREMVSGERGRGVRPCHELAGITHM